MADNRANKDKRQRQNRARREARAARSAHAGEATAISRGEAEETPKTTSSRVAASDDSGRRGKPAVEDRRAAAKERMRARYPIPGQRAMFLGLVFTAVFVVTTLFTEFPIPDTVPSDDPRVEAADSVDELRDGTMVEVAQTALGDDAPPLDVRIYENGRLFDEQDPVPAGIILLAPSVICAGAYWFTKREQRNLVWTMALFALTGYFMFAQPYSLFVLPSLVAVGVGAFQSRKAANEPRMAELRAQREARRAAEAEKKANGGEVIDVDPVDDDTPDDDS